MKKQIKEELANLFNKFCSEEQGNRVTTNNMSGLYQKISIEIDKITAEEKEGD